ncbi:MAG TPA: TetR family transcriptional regulator [Candidatus Binataceae bacterium]|nr:TetR family transcriptional regulator [Candidatus Binataceae bacterium]
MAQLRDLARTRERLLEAALAEFAAHGLAGARCATIARRARVNQRMIFYCFGSKENLYREILRRKFTARADFFESAPEDLAGAILHWYEAGASDLDWVRLLEWEALSTNSSKLVGENERREYLKRAFGRLRRAQTAGTLPPELDIAQLHLSIISLTLFPLAFPQMTRLATGLDPTDPSFRRKRLQFLRWLGDRLADGKTATASSSRGKRVKTNGKVEHLTSVRVD